MEKTFTNSEAQFMAFLLDSEKPLGERFDLARTMIRSGQVDVNSIAHAAEREETLVSELIWRLADNHESELVPILRFLLEEGFDPRSNGGQTGAWALTDGLNYVHDRDGEKIEAFRLLLQAGADPCAVPEGEGESAIQKLDFDVTFGMHAGFDCRRYASDAAIVAMMRAACDREDLAGFGTFRQFLGEKIRFCSICRDPMLGDGGKRNICRVGADCWEYHGMLVLKSDRHILCVNSENDLYVNDCLIFDSNEPQSEGLSSLSGSLDGCVVEDIEFGKADVLLVPNEATGRTATYPNVPVHLRLSSRRTLTLNLEYDKGKGGLFSHIRIH